jgi:hypothetical protein
MERLSNDRRQTAYILGRYLGRSTAYWIGILEMGFGTLSLGINLTGTVVMSPTGVLAIASGLGALGSVAVLAHGTAVIYTVAWRSVHDPLPNVVFASAGGEPSGPYGTKAQRQQLGEDLARQTGGRVGTVQGQGRKVTWEGAARGRRNIVARLMDSGGIRNEPYWRIGIDGVGSFSIDGRLISTNDPLIVHHAYTETTMDDLIELLGIARAWTP